MRRTMGGWVNALVNARSNGQEKSEKKVKEKRADREGTQRGGARAKRGMRHRFAHDAAPAPLRKRFLRQFSGLSPRRIQHLRYVTR